MNISVRDRPEEQVSRFFTILGQPARIQILLAIRTQEACVCHLEVVLGLRQASISQHLMAMRKAGLVTAKRDGRNIFYRLACPEIIDLVERTATLLGIDPALLQVQTTRPVPGCCCPQCNPDMDPKQTCKSR
jgi:DNA-binding transcriptional ArsR family regulator